MYEHQASTTPIASDHATTSTPLQGAAPKTAEPSSSTTGEAGKGKPKKGGKDKPKAKDGKGKGGVDRFSWLAHVVDHPEVMGAFCGDGVAGQRQLHRNGGW